MASKINNIKGNPYRNSSLTNTATLVRGGNTDIYGVSVLNSTASNIFIQFFDKASISDVTLGTTVPSEVIEVAANGQTFFELENNPWRSFTNGLVVAATTTATGSSAPGSAAVISITYL